MPRASVSECRRRQIVLEGAGNRAVARVGQQDRLAVGGKQRPQAACRARFPAGPGNLPFRSSRADFAQIGTDALAEMGEIRLGDEWVFVSCRSC